jgi:UDP-3-O-[3-hydroxymyristoyl] glucosamine N-acyltransferase
MSEPLFDLPRDGLALREVIALTGATPGCEADLERRVRGIATLDRASPADICCFDRAELADAAAACEAGSCLTVARLAPLLAPRVVPLLVETPYRAFVAVANALFPAAVRPSSLFEGRDVSPGATVHPTARLESGVTIDPGAVVGPRAQIGAGTIVAAGAVIGADVAVGRACFVGTQASISHTLIGDRVIIHPGCRIGQAGIDRPANEAAGPADAPLKLVQTGRVIIQDDVEIGANATVDRGVLGDTVIGEGAKIDNLVRISQNAMIARGAMLTGKGT